VSGWPPRLGCTALRTARIRRPSQYATATALPRWHLYPADPATPQTPSLPPSLPPSLSLSPSRARSKLATAPEEVDSEDTRDGSAADAVIEGLLSPRGPGRAAAAARDAELNAALAIATRVVRGPRARGCVWTRTSGFPRGPWFDGALSPAPR
jgi:hypothetical protein